ncbi:TetR/AcrR family transcriptional regulator [Brevundimonas sp. VNH65]|uniref:TetR/AcrR family transcriptional regulator n=1 Tax=Brevundimonas sp. VNH65 TaxID=3400917 RepID=UPI003C0DC337
MDTEKPVPMGRRERMKAQTAQNIRETAAHLFRTVGFQDVTLRALADAAGVSTGAIFAHVRNKEELWRFAMGSAPPDYDLAEVVALIEATLPGAKWTLTAVGDRFGAAVTAGDSEHTALGDTPSKALNEVFRAALGAIEGRQ